MDVGASNGDRHRPPYFRGFTKIKSGHLRLAVIDGMAECRPNFRASQLAAATTPRSRDPPTATGFPRRSGLSRCSTDA